MGVIIYNGMSSSDLGVQVEKFPNYSMPEKEYDIIHVPGRNGDVLFDKGTFKNVKRDYEISVATLHDDFYKVINPVAEWLHSSSGYTTLEDSYEPEFYRLAVFRESNNFENILNGAGRATISFDCKPQRFLKSGDVPITVSSNTDITNDTGFSSLPIISVGLTRNQAGILRVGHCVMTIHAQDLSDTFVLTINSEIQDVYSNTLNCNSMVEFSGGEFPTLEAGANNITYSGGVSSVTITPKWWTI